MLVKILPWLLAFICLYIIGCVGLGILPEIGTISNYQAVNEVLINLSYSVLAAIIFFLFTSVLPRMVLIRRSKKISGQQIDELLRRLFIVINQILHVYDIKKPFEKIEERDLSCINDDTSKRMTGYYSFGTYHKPYLSKHNDMGDLLDSFTFPEDISKKLSEIPSLINDIRKANPNFYVDATLAEILSSIETDDIIEWYGTKQLKLFLFSNSSSKLYKLICDYKRLSKLKYTLHRNVSHRIQFMTHEEYKESLKNAFPGMHSEGMHVFDTQT